MAFVLAALTPTSRTLAQPITTTPELAYDLGEIPSARAVAMGGALNALGVSTTALYLNPANMALARVYHIESLSAFSPEAKRQTYGLAIVDSVLNAGRVAGGLGGSWSEMDPSGTHRSWTDVRAALALPLGSYLAVGATGRWLRVDQSVGAGPFGHSFASDGTTDGPLFNALTFDVGATVSLGDALRIGVAGHNLTNPGTALAPTLGAAGLAYGSHELSIEADGLLDFTTYGSVRGRLMAGAEAFLADRYALRAGWRFDGGARVHTVSLGLGYIEPRWSVEIAVRHDLLSDHGSTFAVLSLRYFYDATNSSTAADEPDMQ
ncbi:MAG: hypothetical protein M3O36_11525 [Myxococcota bacterium]|nr:hypothetical protein [Myxococcota bacterium]